MNQFTYLKKLSDSMTLALIATALLAIAPARGSADDSTNEFTKGVIDMGIVVRNADRTAQFLTNAIGFKEIKGFPVSADLGKKIGLIDGHAVDVRVFKLTEGEQATCIKVLSFPRVKAGKPSQKFIHSTLGMRYLTLYVKDMNRALERLKTTHTPLLGETPLDLGSGTYIAVVKDPDGNFIEIIGPMKK